MAQIKRIIFFQSVLLGFIKPAKLERPVFLFKKKSRTFLKILKGNYYIYRLM